MLRPMLAALVVLALLAAGCTSQPVEPASSDPNSAAPPPAVSNGTAAANRTASAAANSTTRAVPQVDLAVGATGIYPVNPAFDPATLSVPAGAMVNLTFSNGDTLPINNHDWVLEGFESSAGTAAIAPGETTSVLFAAPPPGEYPYYCSVGDHRSRGMEGTLTVA